VFFRLGNYSAEYTNDGIVLYRMLNQIALDHHGKENYMIIRMKAVLSLLAVYSLLGSDQATRLRTTHSRAASEIPKSRVPSPHLPREQTASCGGALVDLEGPTSIFEQAHRNRQPDLNDLLFPSESPANNPLTEVNLQIPTQESPRGESLVLEMEQLNTGTPASERRIRTPTQEARIRGYEHAGRPLSRLQNGVKRAALCMRHKIKQIGIYCKRNPRKIFVNSLCTASTVTICTLAVIGGIKVYEVAVNAADRCDSAAAIGLEAAERCDTTTLYCQDAGQRCDATTAMLMNVTRLCMDLSNEAYTQLQQVLVALQACKENTIGTLCQSKP